MIPRRRIGPLTITRRAAVIAAAAGALLAAVAWAGTGYRDRDTSTNPRACRACAGSLLRTEAAGVAPRPPIPRTYGAPEGCRPRGVYIVIDQTQNRLYLKKDEETLLDATCSAGFGMVLKESVDKKREWVFDTPRGRFEVLSMMRDPVWAKPDWAFVEEGVPIPTNPADRLSRISPGIRA